MILIIGFIIVGIISLGLCFGWFEIDDLTTNANGESKVLKKKWHAAKASFQICFSSAISLGSFVSLWDTIWFFLFILSLTALLFNLTINIVRGRKNLLYVGKGGPEGLFYKHPWLWNLIMLIILILTAVKLELWNI